MTETDWIKESQKKLLVTASTFPRWEGDTEPRFILDLVSHMTKEFDVTVLVPAAPGAKEWELMEGVKVIRYHYFPVHRWETLCYPGAIVPRIKEKKTRIFLVPFLLFALYIQLAKKLPEYDLVHAHWMIPQGIVQAFFKKPYLLTGHGGDVTSFNRGILKILKIRCLEKASCITVVSESLKRCVEKIVPGSSAVTAEVISMGVNTAKFGKQYRKENYFGQGCKKAVLFVGRLVEKKGVTYLIEAMKVVDAVLAIVGDGPLREALTVQAREQGNKIRFPGAKTHEELRYIYASADVFAAPSVTAENGDQEGLPTTILEAMASGVPVVASNSGGISQLIENETNGLLCEERNTVQLGIQINRLLSDNVLYQQIRDNMVKTVKRYDYNVIASKYIEKLKRL